MNGFRKSDNEDSVVFVVGPESFRDITIKHRCELVLLLSLFGKKQ